MTIASTSTIVAMVSRCIVARCWAMGTTSTVCASRRANTRRASRSAPPGVVRSPTPTATTPSASSRTSPPSRCSRCGAVELLDAGEARVVGVDGGGDGALAVPGRHGQRRHRDLVAHPDRGVAGEQQVGQRRDDEVRRGPSPRRPARARRAARRGPARRSARRPGPRGRARRGAWSRPAAGVAPSRGSSTAAAISSARADGKDSTSASSRSRCSTSTPRSVQRLRRTRRAPPARGRPRGRRRRAAGRCCAG